MIPKTILVYEGGIFQSVAHRLARDYERVLYFRQWVSTFPHSNDYQIGRGYDNIERVDYFWDAMPYADVFCFPDIGYADLEMFLRSMGRPVFGAGSGADMELLRAPFKELLTELGLPVAPYKVVTGIDELREELEKTNDKYIKVSLLRGIAESWHHINYDLSEPKLADMEHELGARAKIQEFIIEDAIPTENEVGYDGYNVHGLFPHQALFGYEIKDKAYFGKVVPYSALDKNIRLVNDKLAPVFAQYQYQGFVSTEIRVSNGKPYLNDMTCRAPSPAGEAFQELCENFGEVVDGAAHGVLVEWKPKAKYAAQVILKSDFAEDNWLPITIPDDLKDCVKLFHSCKVEGQEYVVPMELDMPQIGSVVAIGNTKQEAAKRCLEYAERIEAYGLTFEKEALAEAMKAID